LSDGGAGSAAYEVRANVLILGENALATAAALAAVHAAGYHADGPLDHERGSALIAEGGQRLIVLAAAAEDGPALDVLLAEMDQAGAHGRCRGLVILAPDMIDRVAAAISHPAIELLCDPTPVEIAGALALHLARPRRVADLSGDDTRRLRDLSEEVGRIAQALASLSEETQAGQGLRERQRGYEVEPLSYESGMVTADDVRRLIRARRMRARFFDSELFADPAWDMLLDLAAARLEGGSVAVSSLCIAAAVPPTTALRWIRMMSDQGIFVRSADPMDGRRVFIGLSDRVARAMNAYFSAVKEAGLLA
jgi:hypothetical protein